MNKFICLTTVRECRVLTPTGWIAMLMGFGLVMVLVILFVHPFLAPTKPIHGDILVVEGWLPDYALKKVKGYFQKGGYKLLVTTGGRIRTGSFVSKHETWAELASSSLNELGVSQKKIIAVPGLLNIKKDRTYHAALAVKKRLYTEGLNDTSIDIVSLGTHARRSWFLFGDVFSTANVGVISISPNDYDVSQWWFFSEGVRSVVSESIAYFYARFIFSSPT
jgi:hypothetical protein